MGTKGKAGHISQFEASSDQCSSTSLIAHRSRPDSTMQSVGLCSVINIRPIENINRILRQNKILREKNSTNVDINKKTYLGLPKSS